MMTRIAITTRNGLVHQRGLSTAALVATAAAVALSGCRDQEPLPAEEPEAGSLGPAGTGLGTGLPCDVQAIIENRCIACHDGSTPPPKLLDYDDLVASSTKDPAKARVVIAVELMKGNAMPPRPAAQPEPDEIASFETWIMNGTPRNPSACTDPPPPPRPPGDGGVSGTCTSGQMWTMGNQGSPLMHPGAACNACHQVEGGPNLRFAGTVYPSLHEIDGCHGAGPPPPLTVSITDTRGRVFDMAVNEAGNFFLRSAAGGPPPRPPFRARVTDGTKTREMNGSVTSGDCNSCHTVAGANGAPGRILAP
jgi:mono/diheme cytochrome c family protein